MSLLLAVIGILVLAVVAYAVVKFVGYKREADAEDRYEGEDQ